jgi:hypothetical protein
MPRICTIRAGELGTKDVEMIVTILTSPEQFNIPNYYLNRRRDRKTNKDIQVCALAKLSSFIFVLYDGSCALMSNLFCIAWC